MLIYNKNMESILEEILLLVKKKMREQGAYDREAFHFYIEETIDYFIEKGKISDDDNIEFIEDRLLEMWPNVESKLVN